MIRSRNGRVDKIRSNINSLRHDYGHALTSAGSALQAGIKQLTAHELEAIQLHCEETLGHLHNLKQKGSVLDKALAPATLFQQAVGRTVSNTRQSLAIVDNTRREVAACVRGEPREKSVRATSPGLDETAAHSAERPSDLTDPATEAGRITPDQEDSAEPTKPAATNGASTTARTADTKPSTATPAPSPKDTKQRSRPQSTASSTSKNSAQAKAAGKKATGAKSTASKQAASTSRSAATRKTGGTAKSAKKPATAPKASSTRKTGTQGTKASTGKKTTASSRQSRATPNASASKTKTTSKASAKPTKSSPKNNTGTGSKSSSRQGD